MIACGAVEVDRSVMGDEDHELDRTDATECSSERYGTEVISPVARRVSRHLCQKLAYSVFMVR